MFDVIGISDDGERKVYGIQLIEGRTMFLFWNRDEWIWDFASNYIAKPINL